MGSGLQGLWSKTETMIKKILPPQTKEKIHRLNLMRLKKKYGTHSGYDAGRYWNDLHVKFGADIRAVGRHRDKNKDIELYANSEEIFVQLCSRTGIDFKKCRVLEIGCGSGYWTSVVAALGCPDYVGVDISDFAIKKAREAFPTFKFELLDVTEQEIHGQYDVVMMIDVTQHITDKDKFVYAMKNVRNALKEDGRFMVTSYLKDRPAHYNFYCVPWHMKDYQTVFPENSYAFTIEEGFNEKQIMVIERC